MLTFVEPQDILRIEADALINTVNTMGFMGKGVAKAFARDRRFNPKRPDRPEIWLVEDYRARCAKKLVKAGVPYVWCNPESNQLLLLDTRVPRFVINFPTKEHYRFPSELSWIDRGLRLLPQIVDEYAIQSLAMPAVGCGNGGLDWNAVRQLIEAHLGGLAIPIVVVEPESRAKSHVDH